MPSTQSMLSSVSRTNATKIAQSSALNFSPVLLRTKHLAKKATTVMEQANVPVMRTYSEVDCGLYVGSTANGNSKFGGNSLNNGISDSR